MIPDGKSPLTVELIEKFTENRNQHPEERHKHYPHWHPKQLPQERQSCSKRQRRANEPQRLLPEKSQRTFVRLNTDILEPRGAQKPLIPPRRIPTIIMVRLLVNPRAERRGENQPAAHLHKAEEADGRSHW